MFKCASNLNKVIEPGQEYRHLDQSQSLVKKLLTNLLTKSPKKA